MFDEIKPHIAELQKRLIFCVLALIAGFLICFGFWEIILDFMTSPLKDTLPEGSNIVFIKVQEAFLTAVKVSFFAGFLLVLPFILYQIWSFVAPGLYDNEKKLVLPFVLFASFMFLLGAAFCYFLVVPLAFAFLVNFGSELFAAMPSIEEYVSLFIKLVLAFGVAYELPVFIFFLAKLGLVTDKSLKKHFRVAILLLFIFAAIMTPPDVLSQFLMAVPLIGLYALSILIAKWVNPEVQE